MEGPLPLHLLELQHLLVTKVCTACVVAGARAAVGGGAGLGLVTVAGHTGLVARPRHAPSHALPLTEAGVNLSEGRPPVWYLVPTLHHEGVHSTGTILRTWQQLS